MILIVSGPGGVGKGTVVDRLLQLEPGVWLSRSWTTRARRPGEPADAYVFVSREDFLRRAEAGGFVEWTEFPGNGQLYGTPTIDAPAGVDVLLEIELDGAEQVKRRHPEATVVLVVAPSVEEQEARLRSRGDDAASVAARLRVGRDESRRGRELADAVVVNDDVDRAAREVQGILRRFREAG
jgi:guanylate kinase